MPRLGRNGRWYSRRGFARVSIVLALLSVAVLALASRGTPDSSAHSINISSATQFGLLDGGAGDHDGAANGTFAVSDGSLTIASGGSITCNDDASSSGSACDIVISVNGDFTMACGSSVFAEDRNGGGSGGDITIFATGNITLAGGCGQSAPIISSAKLAGAGDTGVAGNITILGTGAGSAVSIGSGALVTADARGKAGTITINAPKTINVDGTISSGYARAGATTLSRGGPISINAGCTLTVTGRISSRGQDPGADLVHLQGCNVFIYGLVESTGPGHSPGTPPGSTPRNCYDADGSGPNPPNRPDKPPQSTACVEIWAGGSLTISSASGHNADVNADTALSGGTQGLGWIDLFARNDLIIESGENSGAYNCVSDVTDYAVHANQCLSGTGGVITVRTQLGHLSTSGKVIQADSLIAGARGGRVVVEANASIALGSASVRAAGANGGGGSQSGGSINARSYNGQLLGFAPGALDTRDGPSTPGGSVVLQGCGSGGSTDGVQYTGSTSPAASILTNSCGGAPAFSSYVTLPVCNCGPTPPPTPSPTPSPKPTPTPSPRPTPTFTPRPRLTIPPTPTLSPRTTHGPTPAPTPTPTPTGPVEGTPAQTFLHGTATPPAEIPTPTVVPTPTPTNTPRPTIQHATATKKPVPTPTPTDTATPHPSSTVLHAVITPVPTARPAAFRPGSSATPVPTPTPSETPRESPSPPPLVVAVPPVVGGGNNTGAVVPPPSDETHPRVVRSVPELSEISISASAVSTNFGLAVITLIILVLSATVLNETLEENEKTIGILLKKSRAPFAGMLGTGTGIAGGQINYGPMRTLILPLLALAGAAVLYGFEEPGFGLNDRSLVLFFSYLGAFALVTYSYEGAQLLVSRRYGAPAAIRVFPTGVVVALVCVIITVLTGFVPGLMYGFIAAHTLVGKVKLDEEQEGKQVFFAAAALLGICLLAWLAIEPLRQFADDNGGWLAAVPEGIAVGLFVSGLEGLFFQMIPIRFLDGQKLMKWNKYIWATIALLSGFLFWEAMINDDRQSLDAVAHTKSLIALAIVVGCLVFTIVVYLLFHFLANRVSLGEEDMELETE